ncbi:MAG: hypothetical protein GTN69_09260 [Armatimonadetes bacterium]|nr:hypothetical protein [Armatimonadota bacterium]
MQQQSEQIAKRVVSHLIWPVLCLIVLALMYHHDFSALYRADTMDAAQAARRISEGRGFTTGFIRPLSLAYHPETENHPDLYQPPLYPLTLGLLFCVLPDSDRTVALASCFFFLLTLLLTFFLAKRMFGSGVAGLSILLVGLNVAILQIAISGAPIAFWLFLMTLLFFLLLRHPGALKTSLLLGVVFGLCFLAEYASLFVLPALLWLLFSMLRERRWAHLGVFVVGCLLILTPWGIRNAILTGSPWFSLRWYSLAMFGGTYQGFSLMRETAPPAGGVLGFVFSHKIEMLKKAVLGTRSLYNGFPLLCGLYVLPFFVAGILHRLEEDRSRSLRKCLYAMIILMSIGGALTTGAAEIFSPLIPLITIFAAACFEMLLKSRGFSIRLRAAAKGLLIVVAGLPILINLLLPAGRAGPRQQNLQQIERGLPAEAIVATDIPWGVAWYAHRDAIWLPNIRIERGETLGDPTRTDAFVAIDGPHQRIKAIFLSSHLLSYPSGENLVAWQALNVVPEGFELKPALAGGEILLTRVEFAADEK